MITTTAHDPDLSIRIGTPFFLCIAKSVKALSAAKNPFLIADSGSEGKSSSRTTKSCRVSCKKSAHALPPCPS